MESYGFSLLELSTNMTDPHAFHRLSPVCLPPEDLKMNTLDPLRLYALGPRNEKEYGEHVAEDRFYTDIRRGDTVVRSCFEDDGEPHYAYSHGSICLDSNVCGGDIGAAFVKEMEGGRMVAVAIARNGGWFGGLILGIRKKSFFFWFFFSAFSKIILIFRKSSHKMKNWNIKRIIKLKKKK